MAHTCSSLTRARASHCCSSRALDARLGAGSQSRRCRGQPECLRSTTGHGAFRQAALPLLDPPDGRGSLSVLTARGAVPAHIVGASMGGYIAMTLAKYHPTGRRFARLDRPDHRRTPVPNGARGNVAGVAEGRQTSTQPDMRPGAERSSPGIAVTRSAECNPSKGAHDGERRGAPS
jgi:pimeloyl-ACP methyl ester carboxylesterase